MLYVIEDTIEKLPNEKIDSARLTIGYMSLEELEEQYERFRFSEESIRDCREESINFRTSYSVCEDYIYSKLHLVKVHNIMESNEKISIFVKKNLCLIVAISDPERHVEQIVKNILLKCKSNRNSIEKVLYLFFDELLREDNKRLEDLEFELNLLEDTIVAKRVSDDFPQELLARKRELFVLRNYYEELVEYSEVLLENEIDIFSQRNFKYLKMLNNKISRLKQNTLFLRENLVQLREAYQSYLDYSLNYIMKVFTVVTTIFSPLSLIVGWYGMNFESMPEFAWRYGYVFVIILTITTLLICFWFFKKKKLI